MSAVMSGYSQALAWSCSEEGKLSRIVYMLEMKEAKFNDSIMLSYIILLFYREIWCLYQTRIDGLDELEQSHKGV